MLTCILVVTMGAFEILFLEMNCILMTFSETIFKEHFWAKLALEGLFTSKVDMFDVLTHGRLRPVGLATALKVTNQRRRPFFSHVTVSFMV